MVAFELMSNCIPKACAIKVRTNDEILIAMAGNGRIYYLNDTAKYIYSCCNGTNHISDILESLIVEYEINEDEISMVKNDLIDELRNMQLEQLVEIWR